MGSAYGEERAGDDTAAGGILLKAGDDDMDGSVSGGCSVMGGGGGSETWPGYTGEHNTHTHTLRNQLAKKIHDYHTPLTSPLPGATSGAE